MKGILFENGIELQVKTEQESWTQGDQMTGTIGLIGSQRQPVILKLVYKLTKTNEQVIQEQKIVCENETSWSFQLAQDSPISDKKGSLLLMYGFAEGRVSTLHLPVAPHFLISAFLQTFEKNFDFLSKPLKYHQGFVKTKMIPPDSERFAKLNDVHCAWCVKNDAFYVHYRFRIQKFGRDKKTDQLQIVCQTETFQQEQALVSCLNGGYPHRRVLKKMIEEAFEQCFF